MSLTTGEAVVLDAACKRFCGTDCAVRRKRSAGTEATEVTLEKSPGCGWPPDHLEMDR
jgi:hypothetical protein